MLQAKDLYLGASRPEGKTRVIHPVECTIVCWPLDLGLERLEIERGETISRSSMLIDKTAVVITQVIILVKMH